MREQSDVMLADVGVDGIEGVEVLARWGGEGGVKLEMETTIETQMEMNWERQGVV